jgi:hypothetical protein
VGHKVTCPVCHSTLRIPEGVAGRWVSCPRCLASILNPEPSPAGAFRPEEPSRTTCPWCGERVEAAWRVCPYCEESLQPGGQASGVVILEQEQRSPSPVSRRTRARRPGVPVDREVQQDTKGVLIGLGVMTAMILLGILIFAGLGGGDLVGASKEGPFILGMGILFLGAIGVCVFALVAKTPSSGGKVLSGLLGGLAVGATVALSVTLLAICAFFSFVISVLDTCTKCGR